MRPVPPPLRSLPRRLGRKEEKVGENTFATIRAEPSQTKTNHCCSKYYTNFGPQFRMLHTGHWLLYVNSLVSLVSFFVAHKAKACRKHLVCCCCCSSYCYCHCCWSCYCCCCQPHSGACNATTTTSSGCSCYPRITCSISSSRTKLLKSSFLRK